VQCGVLVMSGTWEAEAGRSLEPRSLSPHWAKKSPGYPGYFYLYLEMFFGNHKWKGVGWEICYLYIVGAHGPYNPGCPSTLDPHASA
jgi:hypothetical protein